jgi:HSP20 family molecular chaperone IbpA
MTSYYMTRPMHFHRALGYAPQGFNGGRRMPVDVTSDNEAYVIRAAVPGLKPEDVEIQIHDIVLCAASRPKAGNATYLMQMIRDSTPPAAPRGGQRRQGRGND